MKKLLIMLVLFLFSLASFSQERELSNYEKYRLEQEKVELTPDTVYIDTLIVEVPAKETVIINNYYEDDNDWEWRNGINYRLYFGYSYYNPYCSPYYSYWNPWYYDYGYYGYNYYPYYHSNYNRNYYSNNTYRGTKYASSGSLGRKTNYYNNPYSKTTKIGYASKPTSPKKNNIGNRSVATTRPGAIKSTQPLARTKSRAYSPTYTKPRTSVNTNRPRTYNKPKTSTRSTSTYQRSTTVRTPQKSSATYQRPSSGSRSSAGSGYSRSSSTNRSSGYSRPSSGSRSYSTPSRSSSSSSRSYSTPSRSSSSSSRSSGSRSSGSSSSRSTGARR